MESWKIQGLQQFELYISFLHIENEKIEIKRYFCILNNYTNNSHKFRKINFHLYNFEYLILIGKMLNYMNFL